MGVTYKLNDDVIEFIIDQKKQNPSISVRKLAKITGDRFQIKVSKSSVSTVLKNASLSSSVGRRRSGPAQTKAFEIPQGKKEQISVHMQKAGFVKGPESPPKNEQPIPAKEPETEPEAPAELPKQEEQLPLLPDPLLKPLAEEKPPQPEPEAVGEKVHEEDFRQHVDRIRAAKKERAGESLPGTGYVFLKAAEWDLSDRPLIAGLLEGHMSGSSDDVFLSACELFLYLKFLGAKNAGQINDYRPHGLWPLSCPDAESADGEKINHKLEEIFRWSGDAAEPVRHQVTLAYELEKKYLLTNAGTFRLILDDGSGIDLSSDLSGRQKPGNVPIGKALSRLSGAIVSNARSPVFYAARGTSKIDPDFYRLIKVFVNTKGQKFEKAVVLNSRQEQLAEFTTVPVQKRTFLMGIMPAHKEFSELTKNAKWTNKVPYYHEPTDRTVYYGESKTDGLSDIVPDVAAPFRTVAVWNNREDSPFWVILTNDQRISAQAVIESYMDRWPYFGMPDFSPDHGEVEKDHKLLDVSSLKSFDDIFPDYINFLSQHALSRFFSQKFAGFDISQMIQDIYGSNGGMKAGKNHIIAYIDIPESSSCRPDIEQAARTVNQSDIKDPFGRKLWVELRSI